MGRGPPTPRFQSSWLLFSPGAYTASLFTLRSDSSGRPPGVRTMPSLPSWLAGQPVLGIHPALDGLTSRVRATSTAPRRTSGSSFPSPWPARPLPGRQHSSQPQSFCNTGHSLGGTSLPVVPVSSWLFSPVLPNELHNQFLWIQKNPGGVCTGTAVNLQVTSGRRSLRSAGSP